MEQLKKQVGRARRRLGLQRFVGVLGWCCFATLLVALVLIVVDKFWPLGLEPWIWGAGAIGLGILAAAAWAVVRGRGPIDAAIEIDRRFGLRERVSSALAISKVERETAPGQALIDDAVRRVRRIDVREHFAVLPGRQLLLPLVPGVIAVLVALLVSPAMPKPQAQAGPDPAIKKQIEQSTKDLRQKLQRQLDQAREEGLKDAEELLKRLEEGTEDLAEQSEGKRKQALVKLNDLAREIQERREQLGGADKLQEQLNQLKNIDQGPADKFLKAVKQGDFKQAMEELEKLAKLAEGELSDQDREKLAKQLDQMQEKLEKLVEAHRQAEQDLQKRIDQARQQGRLDEAERLEQQAENLRQQLPQMNQLQNLANKLGQCAQCLQDGQLQDAGEMLAGLQADVANLQEQLQELQLLNEALDQLGQCRAQMNCPKCGGLGCAQCRGGLGMGAGKGEGEGDGLGEGQGRGDRPEEEEEVDFIDTRPVMKVGPGGGSLVGEVEGPNYRGDVQQELKEQFETIQQRSADPLAGQQMSRRQQDHAKEYFDRIREGN